MQVTSIFSFSENVFKILFSSGSLNHLIMSRRVKSRITEWKNIEVLFLNMEMQAEFI